MVLLNSISRAVEIKSSYFLNQTTKTIVVQIVILRLFQIIILQK